MADFPTEEDLFRVGRDEILANSKRLTSAIVDRKGTDANALVRSQSAIGDEVVGQLARVEGSLFLDSARGLLLDRLAFDRYNLLRKPAAPAIGSVEFTTTAAAPSAFSIPVGTRLTTANGSVFLTTVATTYSAGSVGPVSVAVQSAKAGLNQQAQIGTITSLASTITGAPSDLRVTNALATAGADDAELDDDLRERCRNFWTTVQKGTLAAIEQDALTIPGIRKAVALEFLDGYGRPSRAVELIVADAFTEALVATAPTPAAYSAQSQVLANAVFAGLTDTRAAGIYVLVRVATVVLQGVVLALTFRAGVDVNLVAFRARVAVVNYMNSLAPGATFSVDGALAALRNVPGLLITGNEIYSPVGDVVPLPLQALRATMGLVVASSLQPDTALQGNTNPDSL